MQAEQLARHGPERPVRASAAERVAGYAKGGKGPSLSGFSHEAGLANTFLPDELDYLPGLAAADFDGRGQQRVQLRPPANETRLARPQPDLAGAFPAHLERDDRSRFALGHERRQLAQDKG